MRKTLKRIIVAHFEVNSYPMLGRVYAGVGAVLATASVYLDGWGLMNILAFVLSGFSFISLGLLRRMKR